MTEDAPAIGSNQKAGTSFPQVRDIRVFRASGTPEFQWQRYFACVAYRFVCKLKEFGYGIGPFHHVYFEVSFSESGTAIGPHATDMESWQKRVDVTLPATMLNQSESQLHDPLVGVVRDVLLALAKITGADTRPICLVHELMCKDREDLEILLMNKSTKRYQIQLYYKLKDPHPSVTQVYARVVDSATGAQADWLLAEVDYDEMRALFGGVSTANERLIVRPRKSARSDFYIRDYRERGFDVPIEVELSRVFRSD